jgi:hypothetical protein
MASPIGQHSHEQWLSIIEIDLLVARADHISRVFRAAIFKAVEVNFVSFALVTKKDEYIAFRYRKHGRRSEPGTT